MTRSLGLGALAVDDPEFAVHAEYARVLEHGGFDAYLVEEDETVDPLTLLSALSTLTRRIGLVGAVRVDGHHPFHVARKFASLDHLSRGRAGWRPVAGEPGRTAEFLDVVGQLWDSFSDTAMVRDVATGRYYDPDQLRTPHHEGEHFRVRGPLTISRPPQGHPVLFQTGAVAVGHADVLVVDRPDVVGQHRAGLLWRVLTPEGPPEHVADLAEEWFTRHGVDGVVLRFEDPRAAADFVDRVVPLLRRRGLVRDRARGATLRERLGLPRPGVVR